MFALFAVASIVHVVLVSKEKNSYSSVTFYEFKNTTHRVVFLLSS